MTKNEELIARLLGLHGAYSQASQEVVVALEEIGQALEVNLNEPQIVLSAFERAEAKKQVADKILDEILKLQKELARGH